MKAGLSLLASLLLASAVLSGQSEFSAENATRILRDLSVGIGPRPMGSPAEQGALAYARASFLRSGCDTAYILPMSASSRANTSSGIAVGIRKGASGRIILIGGHIDSAGPEIPGADDDGSGSAIVMELARVLSQRPTQSTLVFCCFGGEEEGLQGSQYFADHFPEIDSVALMLQVDMANGLGTIDLDPDTHGRSAPRWLVRAVVEEFDALGYGGLRYPTHFFSMNYALRAGSGSDHESFLAKGIPAIDLSTDINKPIHTPRDNFENFDTSGLRRSGEVFLGLARRFDAGVPDRTTERYWLLLLPGDIPVFVPFWGLWLFTGISAAAALAALLVLRRGRIPASDPAYVRWSVPKLWPVTVIIVSAGWLSSDLIGLLRGIRHPWFTAIHLYVLFGALAAFLAALLVFRRSWFRLSSDPYPYFRTSAVLLAAMVCLGAFFNTKLIAEPASGLLLLSLALLVPRPGGKLFLLLASPLWLLRLVFSEWSAILFRPAALALPPTAWVSFVVGGVMILLVSLLLFPFVLGAASLRRQSADVARWADGLLRPRMIAVTAGAFLLFGGLLMLLPAYNRLWYRNVEVNEEYDIGNGSRKIEILSSENLVGMHMARADGDSVIAGRTTTVDLAEKNFDTTWVALTRKVAQDSAGPVKRYNVEITLSCARRPYKVAVRYANSRGEMGPIDSPWMSVASRDGGQILEWRYFPDSVLVIPARFDAAAGDSITETIVVTFDRLADPVTVSEEMAYVIPRTTFVATRVYR